MVQLFCHVNPGGFLLFLLECRRCNTSHNTLTPKATPATIKNQEEQHIEKKGNKKYEKGIVHN